MLSCLHTIKRSLETDLQFYATSRMTDECMGYMTLCERNHINYGCFGVYYITPVIFTSHTQHGIVHNYSAHLKSSGSTVLYDIFRYYDLGVVSGAHLYYSSMPSRPIIVTKVKLHHTTPICCSAPT